MKHLVSYQRELSNRRGEFLKADVSSVSPSSEQSNEGLSVSFSKLATSVNLPLPTAR